MASIWDAIKTRVSGKHFENKYLEWVIQEHRYLPILPTTLVPVTEGHHHELDRLYVSISVSENARADEGASFVDAIRNHDRLVILGDPNKALGNSSSEKRQDSARVSDARKRVKDFGLKGTPLPIFVYLNRMREVTSWSQERSLLDALRDEWKSVDGLRDFPADFFEQKLRAGACFFLFDAFDELGTQEARDAIARRVGELANAVAPGGNRVIVSSRIVGYSGQLAQYGFRVLTVQKLSWQLINELVTRWYDTLGEAPLAVQLISALEANPRIAELAVNPMLLSLIVLVQYVKRLIPDRRDLLYDECIKILVERRFAPPQVRQTYNSLLPADEAIVLLQKIAHVLHHGHLREVPRDSLESHILPQVLSNMRNSRAASVPTPDLLKNIEQRSQLLGERGLNEQGLPVMAFSHLTFQEYLTAADLKNSGGTRGQRVVTDDLLRQYHEDPNWWEEVALLYAAQLDFDQRENFFHQLYPPQGRSAIGSC